MSFLISQIKEQKILEMEVDLDKFISDNAITEEMVIHTMIFDKAVFVEEKEVREYLKDKYMYEIQISDEGDSFVAKIISGSQVDTDNEVSIEIRRGVKATVAELLPIQSFSEMQFNDKGEINLSSKFGTINLSEGLPHIIEVARVAEGEHPAYGKLKITQENLESMVSNFKSKVTGVDLAVNEDHQKNEAFGWFKDIFLSFDKQTLYGQVQWNTKGTHALSEKEYRYFSPEFRFNYEHPHTGTTHGPTLLGGALTNYPFLKMEAITELNNKSQGEETMSKETTIDLSVHNAKVVELSGKVSEIQGKLDMTEARNVELSEKVTALEAEKAKAAAEKANEKLFTEGKINKAQLVALNEGKGLLEVIALSEKMNTEPAGTTVEPKTTIELSDKEKQVCEQLGLSHEDYVNANIK